MSSVFPSRSVKHQTSLIYYQWRSPRHDQLSCRHQVQPPGKGGVQIYRGYSKNIPGTLPSLLKKCLTIRANVAPGVGKISYSLPSDCAAHGAVAYTGAYHHYYRPSTTSLCYREWPLDDVCAAAARRGGMSYPATSPGTASSAWGTPRGWSGRHRPGTGPCHITALLSHHLCITMHKRYYTWSLSLSSTVAEVWGPF